MVLPLDFGLTLEQTAVIVGRSVGWVSRQRRAYISGSSVGGEGAISRGGRRNQLMTESEEMDLVQRAIQLTFWVSGFHTVVDSMRYLLEEELGRPVATSTIYQIVKRVAAKTVPNGKPYHLHSLSWKIAERWQKERRTLGKLMPIRNGKLA